MTVFCRCDTAPEEHLGRQFGIASMGLTIGSLVGPPVAGALYKRWGFRAPFIFGMIVTGVDLLARLLLIERHEAMRWGIDPMAVAASVKERDPEAASGVTIVEIAEQPSVIDSQPAVQELANDPTLVGGEGSTNAEGDQMEKQPQTSKSHTTLLPHIALFRLMKSSRAGVCVILTLLWGMVWVGQEAAVVLHMKRVWGLDPHGAGIAFIAAVVPTVVCKSGVLSFSNHATYPDHVDCSRCYFWLAGRQVWASSGRLRRNIVLLALVRVGHHRGLSRDVPDFFCSRG